MSKHSKPTKDDFDKWAAMEESTDYEALAAAYCGLTPRKVEAAIQGGMIDVTAQMYQTDRTLIYRLRNRWVSG